MQVPDASGEAAERHAALRLAQHYFNRRGPGDVERALLDFERIALADPGLVDAWVGIAGCLKILGSRNEIDYEASLARQERVLSAALAIDPQHPEANIRMANVHWYREDEGRTLEFTARALEHGRDSALVLGITSGILRAAGNHAEAIELQRLALSLDPLSLTGLYNLASYLFEAGHFEESLTEFQRARLFAQEEGGEIDARIGQLLVLLNRLSEAEQLVDLIPPGPGGYQLQAMLYHAAGLEAEARVARHQLAAEPGIESSIRLVEVHAFMGEERLALAQLQATDTLIDQTASHARMQTTHYRDLYLSPLLTPLHKHPLWNTWWQSRELKIDDPVSLRELAMTANR
jgi:tetratricopeptide (TPR) repeat protein